MKKLEDVLSENLARLMTAHVDLNSQIKVGKRAGVGQRTVGRILTKDGSPTAANLASIARAFDLAPWQLLVPDLDPGNPPVLKEPTEKEKEFYRRIDALAREMGIKSGK